MTIDLTAVRRELHQIPEVGLHLPQTQSRILAALEGLDLEITTGEGLSSVVAVLRGGRRPSENAPLVLLRADMDALPITEETGLDFASTNGAMHACGHDLHMTMLLGAVYALHEIRDELAGDVLFMFQPGEESVDGCQHMLDEGLLDVAGKTPDFAYAIHVWAALEPAGTVCTKHGTIMASVDEAQVTVRGRGTHGSTPHLGADPVPVMAEMITATHQMVTRRHNIFDPVVVTVGHVEAGSVANIVPESAYFEATMRTFSHAARAQLLADYPTLLQRIAEAHGVTADVNIIEQYPVTVNHPEPTDLVRDLAIRLFGEESHVRWEHPLAGAEDFSRILERVPGCFIGLAATPAGLDPATAPFNHSPKAAFDESVLPKGARLFTELVKYHLTN